MALSFFETARFKLRALQGSNNVSDIDAGFQALAEDIDAVLYKPADLRFTHKATLETGWLRCEGQTVSRVTFAALWKEMGEPNTGNGSTTFTLPDYRERVPMGLGATLKTLGQQTGEAAHKLTAAESGLPDHQHSLGGFATLGSLGTQALGAAGSTEVFGQNFATQTSTVEGGPKDAAAAHNNIQPSTVCNVWIRT